ERQRLDHAYERAAVDGAASGLEARRVRMQLAAPDRFQPYCDERHLADRTAAGCVGDDFRMHRTGPRHRWKRPRRRQRRQRRQEQDAARDQHRPAVSHTAEMLDTTRSGGIACGAAKVRPMKRLCPAILIACALATLTVNAQRRVKFDGKVDYVLTVEKQ